jgi:hypothetical protein
MTAKVVEGSLERVVVMVVLHRQAERDMMCVV